MTVSLRNVSGDQVSPNRDGGDLIDPDELVTVDGDLSDDSPADAYLIGKGSAARLWPKANWKLESTVSKSAKEKS